MKKRTEYTNPLNRDLNNNKDLEIDKVKTTNVNILLNRVRLDQKRNLKTMPTNLDQDPHK